MCRLAISWTTVALAVGAPQAYAGNGIGDLSNPSTVSLTASLIEVGSMSALPGEVDHLLRGDGQAIAFVANHARSLRHDAVIR